LNPSSVARAAVAAPSPHHRRPAPAPIRTGVRRAGRDAVGVPVRCSG
jgi:hypothetical protein